MQHKYPSYIKETKFLSDIANGLFVIAVKPNPMVQRVTITVHGIVEIEFFPSQKMSPVTFTI